MSEFRGYKLQGEVNKKCPKNPCGETHEIEYPVPWIPELRKEWQELSMEEKIVSQYCKWCGKTLW